MLAASLDPPAKHTLVVGQLIPARNPLGSPCGTQFVPPSVVTTSGRWYWVATQTVALGQLIPNRLFDEPAYIVVQWVPSIVFAIAPPSPTT